MGISIAIPSYNRGAVLCETIALLLTLKPAPDEILIVDQTPAHSAEVQDRLREWATTGEIRVIRLPKPSITQAMNTALREAANPYVLFLDDDVIPATDLVARHLAALSEPDVSAVVGQVLQPGEAPGHFEEDLLRRGAVRDLGFRFNHDEACDIQNVMAGNLSMDRARALAIGGFDENFVGVAYRFETDFALRLTASGGRIRYEPAASIRHLKAPGGGIRTWGDHKTSSSPMHSVGDYYFARHHLSGFARYVALRLVKNVATRYHAKHPWMIPGKLVGELRGLLLALSLSRGGRKLAGNRSEMPSDS